MAGNSLKIAIARTKAAMEEDKLIAEVNDMLGAKLRRQMGGFVGLPGYHIEVVIGGMDKVAEAWRRARERAEPIEMPVVLYRTPGKENRALMSVAEFVDLPVSDTLEYTVDMSLASFALLCQQAQVRQMRAIMEAKQFVVEYDLQLQ